MWGAELRGVIAVVLVLAAIAFAWNRIENREVAVDTTDSTTTTTTTTTTVAPTTTLSPAQAALAICERAQTFVDQAAVLPDGDDRDGPLAQLALGFWTDVLDLAAPEIRTEVIAVVNYYESYIETAGPFGFDIEEVIVEGDKERLQQLITRPAPGLESSRGIIAFGCGLEVPDQPMMSTREFDRLEDRLRRNRRE